MHLRQCICLAMICSLCDLESGNSWFEIYMTVFENIDNSIDKSNIIQIGQLEAEIFTILPLGPDQKIKTGKICFPRFSIFITEYLQILH